jgi:hypothetical protein
LYAGVCEKFAPVGAVVVPAGSSIINQIKGENHLFCGQMKQHKTHKVQLIIPVIVIVILVIVHANRNGMGSIDFVFQRRSACVGLYHRLYPNLQQCTSH